MGNMKEHISERFDADKESMYIIRVVSPFLTKCNFIPSFWLNN